MDFTYELAHSFNTLPFEILNQDKDIVIMMINYLIEKGENVEQDLSTNDVKTEHKEKEQRIRVNDKTATNGWW